MLHNKEIKRFIIGEVLILLITIPTILVFNNIIFIQYKNNIIDNNSKLMASLVENHPELEEELVEAIIKSSGNAEKGQEILGKYGLGDVDSLEYVEMVGTIKSKITIYHFTFAIFIFTLLSFIYYMYIRRQYKKIDEIGHYMIKLLNGDYSLDLRDYEEGALSTLKNDIYRITVLLKNQSEQDAKAKRELEDVLSDISHQLKTPLTSMYVISDLLLDETMKPSMRKEFLYKNKVQLERIEWLVTSLLKISRLDSGTIILKEEEINIQKLLSKALEPIEIAVELKKQTILIHGDPKITIKGDFNWTVEALLNILKNAHEHSPAESAIEISYQENALYTSIAVKDHGEGISEKDIPNVFKRFYKGTSSKESIGIGLNMALMIVNKEQGDITVTSTKGEGTTFTILFYKKVV